MTILKQIPYALVLVSLLFVTACDKDRPYDVIKNKNAAGDVQSKSDIDHFSQTGKNIKDNKTNQFFSLSNINKLPAEKQYLAVVSNTTVDLDAPVVPYEMGREVRVVMSFTEDNLIAYEIPSQFSDTDVNFKPFIKIPITHIDYTCALDANQKCTQREIVDTEKAWVDKKYFIPNLDQLKVDTLEGLSSSLRNYANGCSKELQSRVIAYKVEKNAINITLEKTMQQQINCAGVQAFIDPASVTYRVQQNISLVKLNTLISADYEPMVYREVGPNEFGYFKTEVDELDEANKLCRDCHKEYVSRWNPKKTTIDYYLSVNFEKPENAGIKEATYHAIGVINESFKEAGTEMKINLHDGDSNLIEGDIRKNLIVMVEDPISRGLLGYGPSVTNPMTGEIVHARTVMFPGVMKKFVEQAYTEYLELAVKLKQGEGESASEVMGVTEGSGKVTESESALIERQVRAMGYSSIPKELQINRAESLSLMDELLSNLEIIINPNEGLGTDDSYVNLLESYLSTKNLDEMSLHDELDELTAHNYYPADLFNGNEALGGQLKEIIESNEYTAWTELTVEVKQSIVRKLLPIVWIPTLIHEIGHNLGLRHNFHGSFDKGNFYTQEELAEKGIERPMEYSSIMDYSYSSANELSIMGKYDIAALRFAYGEEVELVDGTMVSIHDDLSTSAVKKFEYCSDEGVALGATCNRFDEGSTYLEIVQNTIEKYESDYKLANFKNDRYNYSSVSGDVWAYSRMRSVTQKLRTVFELYEAIAVGSKDTLARQDDPWNTDPFLKDVKDATVLAGQFLIDIVATPDVHCLITLERNGETSTLVAELSQISTRDANCALAGEGLPDGFQVVGQAGKSFNHIRDSRNPSLFIDQIDVRGIWVDKMLALSTLTARTSGLGNFDNITLNFLSVPELEKPILDLLTNIVTDKHEAALVFDTIFGEPLTSPPRKYSLFTNGTHKLKKNFNPLVRHIFGLNRSAPTQFHDLAIQTIKSNAASLDDNDVELGRRLEEMFSVQTWLPNGEDEKDFLSYKIGNETYYAYESNTMARLVMVQIGENQKAEEILELISAENAGSPSSEELTARVEAILELRQGNPLAVAPVGALEVETLAYDIDVDTLETALLGELLPVASFHEAILESL